MLVGQTRYMALIQETVQAYSRESRLHGERQGTIEVEVVKESPRCRMETMRMKDEIGS